jgi:hypothetical protein
LDGSQELFEFSPIAFGAADLLLKNADTPGGFKLRHLSVERLPIGTDPRVAVELHSAANILISASGS